MAYKKKRHKPSKQSRHYIDCYCIAESNAFTYQMCRHSLFVQSLLMQCYCLRLPGTWGDGSIEWARGHSWIKARPTANPRFMESSELEPLVSLHDKRQRSRRKAPLHNNNTRAKNTHFLVTGCSGESSGPTSPRVNHPRMSTRSSANLVWHQKKITSRATQKVHRKLSKLEKSKVARYALRSVQHRFDFQL